MQKKIMFTLLCFGITVGMISGCASKKSDDSLVNDNKETTMEVLQEMTEVIDNTEQEIKEEVIENESSEPTEEIADFRYLYGSPNEIVFRVDEEAVEVYESEDENEVGYYSVNLKITDVGNGYQLEINHIKYQLSITTMEYLAFKERAVSEEYSMTDDGKRLYTLTDDTSLTCRGENFTLISYMVDAQGRGCCELLGDDGENYYINNDISSKMDTFTGITYFDISTVDTIEVIREKQFDNTTILFVPYGTTHDSKFDGYVNGSPDVDSGNPGGSYYIQFDEAGNIVKIEG